MLIMSSDVCDRDLWSCKPATQILIDFCLNVQKNIYFINLHWNYEHIIFTLIYLDFFEGRFFNDYNYLFSNLSML